MPYSEQHEQPCAGHQEHPPQQTHLQVLAQARQPQPKLGEVLAMQPHYANREQNHHRARREVQMRCALQAAQTSEVFDCPVSDMDESKRQNDLYNRHHMN